jgi:hypothetical protein
MRLFGVRHSIGLLIRPKVNYSLDMRIQNALSGEAG